MNDSTVIRRQQARQARRHCIQEAARTVFAERGYAGARIEFIARAANLSVGAIYLYFLSKEDLYVSLIQDALMEFDVEMSQVRERVEATKRLRETWSILVRWAARDTEGPRILHLLAQPALRPQLSCSVVTAVSTGLARIHTHIGASIADGIHAGAYLQVNVSEMADLAWSVLLGSLHAAEIQNNLDIQSESLHVHAERALVLIETLLGVPCPLGAYGSKMSEGPVAL